ncbi:MAG: hypothetical protein RPU34_04330 [Candidatus Sedimenticola sp. (ex Thyasira tokunagai)]
MSSRKKITAACKEQGLEIVTLKFDRSSQPTPSGYVNGGFWMLTVQYGDEHSHFIGDTEDILTEVDSFWELEETPSV